MNLSRSTDAPTFGSDSPPEPTRVLPGVLFSVFAYFGTQVSMFLPNWNWDSFRTFFLQDQLSNFAVLVNASRGNFGSVEPFTETGHLSDPHLYLEALGALSHITGLSPASSWTIGGLALQVALVGCISVEAAHIANRWWASYLGALPFIVGTLSFAGGGWATSLASHAVLWGTFASMFSLNEAVAALAIAGILALMLVGVGLRTEWSRRSSMITLGVGAGIGLIANIDTYGFFTATFFLSYGVAVYAMAVQRRRWTWVLSLGLIVALYIIGPRATETLGRLDAFVLGLVPALPGLIVAIARWRSRVLLPILAALAAAAPQIVSVAAALHGGDPFLTFRIAASGGLGVPWKPGIMCALPLLAPLAMIALAALHRRNPLWLACALGIASAWFIISTNDAWGPNQEPYQLWTDGFALASFIVIPTAIGVAVSYLSSADKRARTEPYRWTIGVIALFVAAVGLVGASSVDWFRFYRSQQGETLSLATPESHAMQSTAARISNDKLVWVDPCVKPAIFKAVTGARVAYYNLGLAWPAHLEEILAVGNSLSIRTIAPREVAAAQIGWLVTSGACAPNWATGLRPILIHVATERYGSPPGDEVALWKFKTSGGSLLVSADVIDAACPPTGGAISYAATLSPC